MFERVGWGRGAGVVIERFKMTKRMKRKMKRERESSLGAGPSRAKRIGSKVRGG